MFRIPLIIWLLLPSISYADTDLIKKVTTSKCGSYELKVVSFELDRGLPEHSFLAKSAGHFGNPYLVKQNLVYTSESGAKDYPISTIWPEYERIDSARYYSANIKQCTDNREALIAFWSGGNCKNVCEAWGLVKFSEDGTIESSQGLSYAQFRQYN